MPRTGTVIVDRSAIETVTEEFNSANILMATIGTNCPRGGDSGHGGRTVFILHDLGGTDLRCSIDDNGQPERVTKIEIVLGGDCECDTFADALEFAARTLRASIGK